MEQSYYHDLPSETTGELAVWLKKQKMSEDRRQKNKNNHKHQHAIKKWKHLTEKILISDAQIASLLVRQAKELITV